jgi:hypothetical protein
VNSAGKRLSSLEASVRGFAPSRRVLIEVAQHSKQFSRLASVARPILASPVAAASTTGPRVLKQKPGSKLGSPVCSDAKRLTCWQSHVFISSDQLRYVKKSVLCFPEERMREALINAWLFEQHALNKIVCFQADTLQQRSVDHRTRCNILELLSMVHAKSGQILAWRAHKRNQTCLSLVVEPQCDAAARMHPPEVRTPGHSIGQSIPA